MCFTGILPVKHWRNAVPYLLQQAANIDYARTRLSVRTKWDRQEPQPPMFNSKASIDTIRRAERNTSDARRTCLPHRLPIALA